MKLKNVTMYNKKSFYCKTLIFISILAIITVSFFNKNFITANSEIDDDFIIVNGSASFDDFEEIPSYLPTQSSFKMGKKVVFKQAGTTIQYKKSILLKDLINEDNSLLQMITMPSEDFKVNKKSPIRSFIVKVTEEGNPNNYFEVGLNGILDQFQADGISSVFAKAVGQQVYAGQHSDTSLIRTRDSGSITSFSFAAQNSNVLELSYNNATAEVKSSPTFGSYGRVVRRFRHSYIKSDPRPNMVTEAATWEGFTPNSRVKIELKLEAFANKVEEAAIMLFSLGGTDLCDKIGTDVNNYGVENSNYLLPVPNAYSNKGVLSKFYNGKYKVYAPNNENVQSGEIKDNVFFPTALPGKYKVEYLDNADGIMLTENIEVLTAEQSSSRAIKITDYIKDYKQILTRPKTPIPIGASATSGIDIIGNSTIISVEIFKDDVLIDEINQISLNSTYTFEEQGVYYIKYNVKDILDRKISTDKIKIDIKNANVGFIGNINEYDYILSTQDLSAFIPKNTDISIYDYVYGTNPSSLEIDIQIKKPNESAFVYIDESFTFDDFGEYVIKYLYKYEEVEGFAERKIYIIDANYFMFEKGEIGNSVRVDHRKESKKSTLYLIAKLNTNLTLPEIKLKDSNAVPNGLKYIEIHPNGEVFDKTNLLSDTEYKIEFTLEGEYILRYEQLFPSGLISTISYVVDVKADWVIVDISGGVSDGNTGTLTPLKSLKTTDFEGKDINIGHLKIIISLNGENVENLSEVKDVYLTKPGRYQITYLINDYEETKYYIDVVDNTKPKIEVGSYKKSGRIGKAFELAKVNISDNDAVKYSKITVTHNGKELNVFDNTFIPTEKGTYKISIWAEDISGNTAYAEYIIEINNSINVLVILLIITSSLLVTVAIFLGVKKYSKKRR